MNPYQQIKFHRVSKELNKNERKYKMITLGVVITIFFIITLFNNSHNQSSTLKKIDEVQQEVIIDIDYKQNEDIKNENLQNKDVKNLNVQNEDKQNKDRQKDQYIDLQEKYQEKKLEHNTIFNRLRNKIYNLKDPRQYNNISSVTNFKQLPFCIITSSKSIFSSLQKQNYTNYKVILKELNQTQRNNIVQIKEQNNLIELSYNLIHDQCGRSTIIIITNKPLKQKALSDLNNVYQKYNIWMTYHIISQDKVSISTFIGHMFYRLYDNDFNKNKKKILGRNKHFFVLSMIQLGKYHSYQFQTEKIFYDKAFFLTQLSHDFFQSLLQIQPYQPLFQLSQTYRVNEYDYLNNQKSMLQNKDFKNRYVAWRQITQQQIIRGIQYVQLKSLPRNHSLFDRQRLYLEQKYQLSKYDQQLPICVVIPSFNNIQNLRYKKCLQTVLYQNYTNYHIVFIDDSSTDQTLNKSIQYLEKQKFDMSRFASIRNHKKMYATYNLQNAAHNYCHPKDIFLILDGDDQLVGAQVFKLFNSRYLIKDNWIVYTSFFTSKLSYGNSQSPTKYKFQSRQKVHIMGPTRTFYNDLFIKIQDKDHKDQYGNYLNSGYDEAMQHPLFEMAGIDRIEYVNQLTYFYNRYSNNDGLNGISDKQRNQKLFQINTRPKYKKLQTLQKLQESPHE